MGRQLKPHALLLADWGSFGFQWFDDLTEQGYRWISRVTHRPTVVVEQTSYEAGETCDRLVWLGAWNTHSKDVVRQGQFRQGGQLWPSFTRMCDPTALPVAEIARLSARRWDIERAFLTLKRERGWHLIWSCKQVVVLAPGWACLIIAQELQAIRMEGAFQAEVDAFEVSLPFRLEALPHVLCWGVMASPKACARGVGSASFDPLHVSRSRLQIFRQSRCSPC